MHKKLYHRLILTTILLLLTINFSTKINISGLPNSFGIFFISAVISGILTLISFGVFINYLKQLDMGCDEAIKYRKILRYRSKIDSKLLCFCGEHEYTAIREYHSKFNADYIYFDSVCIHCKHVNKEATIKEEEDNIVSQPNNEKIQEAKMHYWNSLTAEQKEKIFLEKL